MKCCLCQNQERNSSTGTSHAYQVSSFQMQKDNNMILRHCWLLVLIVGVPEARSLCPMDRLAFMSRQSGDRKTPYSHRMIFSDLGDWIRPLSPMGNSPELWLDLRGTAIHPRAAVDYLEEELVEEGLLFSPLQEAQLIERIILSDFSFQQLLNSSDPFVETSEILYQPEGTTDGLLASSRYGLSLPFGSSIPIPRDHTVAVGDPMGAMQILGGGKWILLENSERELDPDKESVRIDAISSFLDIASTAASGPWRQTASHDDGDLGLIYQSGTVPHVQTKDRGGVAVHCPTKSFLVRLASAIQCVQSISTTTVTESGIIIQGGNTVSVSSLPLAIALPFDVLLWKTAMLVYGQQQFRVVE